VPFTDRFSLQGRGVFFAVTIIGVFTLVLSAAVQRAPYLVWNATPSVPVGLYVVAKPSFTRGELVLANTPEHIRALAAERRYLPSNVPLAKRIAGAPGDEICAKSDWIYVNGARIAERQVHDSSGRKMPAWSGCRVLNDEVFLLLPEVKSSFDGRYFGPIPRASVIGKLTPLWVQKGASTGQSIDANFAHSSSAFNSSPP
jgi:conjugative transfer signal peptidase TraF